MAQLVKPLKVDLTQESSYIYMKVSQYEDNFRKYQVIFTDRGIPINNLRGDELITLHLCESGEEKEYASRDCVWENGYPYITFSSNMLSRAGDIDAKFSIYSKSDPSLSFSRMWHLNVQRSLIDYEGMIASDDFSILHNLIEQALMIPELIEKFNLSQDQINQLIVKINADIASYQQQFTAMKSQWDTSFQEALDAVNAKLAEYQNTFSTMETTWIKTFQDTLDGVNFDIAGYRTDYAVLKGEITDWYTEAQQSEEMRVSSEKQRQETLENTMVLVDQKIAASDKATENAKTATSNADAATEEAKKQAALAEVAAANAKAATEALHYELIDCDGGYASTDPESYENDFNGGGA
ncbi:hypothetical protein [Clostridium sp. AF32-12BH]|uniref:hypothetical protein n=1 Tax=Clostridium sp. AF32-12BH TaxID=2292006 RepID=UPI000E537028|nr:hypothetical protein [Clostridium sp. AF32-12BH]RHP47078.1 hypothetical protein DWZ40_09250 [Clostridium sp. AF32-12BH]